MIGGLSDDRDASADVAGPARSAGGSSPLAAYVVRSSCRRHRHPACSTRSSAASATTASSANDPVGLPDPGSDQLHRDPRVRRLLAAARQQRADRGRHDVLGGRPAAALAAFVFARYDVPRPGGPLHLLRVGLLFPSRSRSCRSSSCCAARPARHPLGVALPQAAFGLPLTIVILRPFFRRSRPRSRTQHSRRLRPLRVLLADPAAAVAPGARHGRRPRRRHELERVPAPAASSSTSPTSGRCRSASRTSRPSTRSDTARILAFTSLAMVPGPDLLRRRRTAAHRRSHCGR